MCGAPTKASELDRFMKYHVYILCFDKLNHYYIGSTNNIDRRLEQHRRGHTPSTKRLGNFQLVFSQEFTTLLEARRIESKLKSWKRRDFIKKIISDGTIQFSHKDNQHP